MPTNSEQNWLSVGNSDGERLTVAEYIKKNPCTFYDNKVKCLNPKCGCHQGWPEKIIDPPMKKKRMRPILALSALALMM